MIEDALDLDAIGLTICIMLLIAVISLCVALYNNTGKYFCPECGERYEDECEYCQYDGALLLERNNH